MAPIYLDHNATTPIAGEVVDAMLPFLREHFGNPSSAHEFGARARAAVERARAEVAELVGVEPAEVVFTSGGTESDNLAVLGVAAALEGRGRHVVTSTIEHPAVELPCAHLEARGWTVSRVAVDATGRLDPAAVEDALRPDTVLVTIMHANNETGVQQPIAEIARVARLRGAVVHTDAAQSIGKVNASLDGLGVDLLTIASHKLYGPKGVGALIVRRGTALHPTTYGAAHEGGLRPGTENVAGVVGLGAACALARRELPQRSVHLRELRDRLHRELGRHVPGLELNGDAEHRLPNTLNVSFPGVRAHALLEAVRDRVATAGGPACHSGDPKPSAVLTAMGLSAARATSALRLCTGRGNTPAEMDAAAEVIGAAWHGLCG